MQELPGHSDVSTTMIYTHVLKVAAGGTASPLDGLLRAAPESGLRVEEPGAAYGVAPPQAGLTDGAPQLEVAYCDFKWVDWMKLAHAIPPRPLVRAVYSRIAA